eukprot:g6372.t1
MHQALRLLLKAETLYLRTKASADEDASALEGAYTMTLFFLAQVFAPSGQTRLAAAYCHGTLQRQLDMAQPDKDRVDPLDWTKNCLHLCEFHLSEGDFVQAEHVLQAAEHMFGKLPRPVDRTAEADRNGNASWSKARADLDFKWANLFGHLLAEGREIFREKLMTGAASVAASAIAAQTAGDADKLTHEAPTPGAAAKGAAEAESKESQLEQASPVSEPGAPDDGALPAGGALSRYAFDGPGLPALDDAPGPRLRFSFERLDAAGMDALSAQLEGDE